jgi:hypothetical protein
VIDAFRRKLDEGLKLLVFEPSGGSDVARLFFGLKNELAGKAHVRWVHFVSASGLSGPSHLIDGPALNAGAVFITRHANQEELARARSVLVEKRASESGIFIQRSPGDLGTIWNSLVRVEEAPSTSRLLPQIYSPSTSAAYRAERTALDEQFHPFTVMLKPDLSKKDLIQQLVRLNGVVRAKGDLVLDGTPTAFHYGLSDARTVQVDTDPLPGSISDFGLGIGCLSVTVMGSMPTTTDLIPLGVRQITKTDVVEAIQSYPTESELSEALENGDPIATSHDEDRLFFEGTQIVQALFSEGEGRIDYVDIDSFCEDVFDPLLSGFVKWNLRALTYLTQENSSLEGHFSRVATLGYNLSWVVQNFGPYLSGSDHIFGSLYGELTAARPATVFFKALSSVEALGKSTWSAPEKNVVSQIINFVRNGVADEQLSRSEVDKALLNLEALATRERIDGWQEQIEFIRGQTGKLWR